jgi:hypothetical protein
MGTNIQPATELFPGDVTKGQIPLDAAEKIEEADGFAQVFPEHKYAIVKILQENGHIVGMTGDGVNDAPALKQADAGIAVSGATEAARAAAALILTAPGLSVIIEGHLMLFVTRTRGPFWKPPYPSPKLFFAIVATQIAAVFMCSQGWLVPPLPWRIIGFVWAYNLVWMIAQDIVKLGLYGVLDPGRSWKSSLFQPLRVPMVGSQKPSR